MKTSSLAPLLLTFLAAACGAEADVGGATSTGTAGMPAGAWSSAPLAGAIDVKDARASHADGDAVVVRGTLQDFGDLATFLLVEDSLEDCSETGEDRCATPWDYCCEDPDRLRDWTINVEFMEGELPADWTLRGAYGLDHLSEVLVAGTLRFDEAGNMRLEAERMSMQ
ncbi:MAG: hypothetical protein AAFU73_04475 [Planctomycetota bacterium]